MKNVLLLVCFVFGASLLLAQKAGTLTMTPENPMPGETVTITYQVGESPLQKAEEVYGMAYCLGGEKTKVLDVALEKDGDTYTGEFTIMEDAKLISVLFEDEAGKLKDDNDKKGYYSFLYEKDRETPVAKAYYQLGSGLMYGYMGYRMDADKEKAMELIQKEFTRAPELKKDKDIFDMYSQVAFGNKDEKAMEEIKEKVEEFAKAKKDEDKMLTAHNIYTYDLKDEELAKKVEKRILKKFPKGDFAKMQASSAFYDARKDSEKMDSAFAEMVALYDLEDKDDKNGYQRAAGMAVSTLIQEKDLEKAKKYLALLDEEHESFAMYARRVVTASAGKTLEDEPVDLELALKYAKKAEKSHRKKMENPGDGPAYQSPRQYKRGLARSEAMYIRDLALVHYKMGKSEKALSYQNKALAINKEATLDWYEEHATYYEATQTPASTEALLVKYIKDNKATDKMKERFKDLFMENNTKEQAFEKYLAVLEKEANKEYREEVEQKMIDEVAPAFSLVNLDGETVQLSDYAGKVVVLDFWATWCGPCKKSFPAMQETLDKNKDNDQVVFLFIDSWQSEEGNDKKDEVVRKFIEENKYTFNVPMDYDNKVIESYKVTGIPTKFVIGPDGNIRFKSVGFRGSNAEMIKELMMMIDIAAQRDNATASIGAP